MGQREDGKRRMGHLMHLCLKVKAGMVDICCSNDNCPPEAMQNLALVLQHKLLSFSPRILESPEDLNILSELVGASSWPTMIGRLCIHIRRTLEAATTELAI